MGSSEGTFTVQYETVYSTNTIQSAYLLAFDSSASKRVVYLQTDLQSVASFDGTTIVSPTGDATGVVAHVASAYSATDRAVVLNGGTVATGTIAAGYSTATSLGIGVSVPFVTIKQIKFYPTRLTNAQLQGLTK
jgi:DNA helicase TIP49 (TBP-interacting protein)